MVSWKKLITPPGKSPKDIKEWLGLITDAIKGIKGSENWYDDVTLLTSDSIVNDLETGGIDKTLSSEQGKILNQNINNLSNKVQTQQTIIEEVTEQMDTNKNLDLTIRKGGIITQPSIFSFPYDIKVYDNLSNFKLNYEIEDFLGQVKGKILFVDWENGNDSNDGLWWGTALKTLGKANELGYGILYIKQGNYGKDSENWRYPVDNNCKVISVGGKSNMFMGWTGDYKEWTQEDKSFYASANMSTLINVYDTTKLNTDNYKEPSKLSLVASIQDCKDTSGSYFYDTTNKKLYIHTRDNRKPDRGIMVITSKSPILALQDTNITNSRKYYFENISFLQGAVISSSSLEKNIFAGFRNCDFSYSTYTNGFNVTGNAFTYCENCVSEYNYADGFNYHDTNNLGCLMIEVNCIGRHNGQGKNDNINNGSTLHEAIKGIRVGGTYHNNEGRNVHDINDSMSWNVGCNAFDSVAISTEARQDFVSWNQAKMWLDKCGGGVLDTPVGEDANLYVRNCVYDKASNIETY